MKLPNSISDCGNHHGRRWARYWSHEPSLLIHHCTPSFFILLPNTPPPPPPSITHPTFNLLCTVWISITSSSFLLACSIFLPPLISLTSVTPPHLIHHQFLWPSSQRDSVSAPSALMLCCYDSSGASGPARRIMHSFRVPNVLCFDAAEPAFPYVCYAKWWTCSCPHRVGTLARVRKRKTIFWKILKALVRDQHESFSIFSHGKKSSRCCKQTFLLLHTGYMGPCWWKFFLKNEKTCQFVTFC